MRIYLKVFGRLDDLIKLVNNDSNQADNSLYKMPRLDLPEFHGNESEWKSFLSRFDRMVHNNKKVKLGDKMDYFKACIKGNAAKIINHIDALPENYSFHI